MTARIRGWLRLLASLASLILILWLLDVEQTWRRLRALDAAWALVTFALCSLQFPLLAARWRLFTVRLALPLTYPQALAEYYLAALLNQLLPLGLAGDAFRLARHRAEVRAEASAAEGVTARVLLALVADRVSGQLALWLAVIALVAPLWDERAAFVALVLFAALIFTALLARRVRALSDLTKLVLSPRALAPHLGLSFVLLALHVASFWATARALGTDLTPWTAARIVPLLMVAGSLPGFFAGWGIREAAAAALYHLNGLYSSDGVAVSLVFGMLGLLASVPGVLALARPRERSIAP